jgi:ribose transport system substrate-binding protein
MLGRIQFVVDAARMRGARTASLCAVTLAVLCTGAGCNRSRAEGAAGDAGGAQSDKCLRAPPLERKANYKVGFVPMYEPANPWSVLNISDMVEEAGKRQYSLVYDPLSKGDPAEQVSHMQSLIERKVDAIILRPMDATALAPTVVAAREACIPVVTVNRFVDPSLALPGKDYVTGIGADPVLQGQVVADWLVKATKGKAAIIEVEGMAGASSTIGRKKGFDDEVTAQPGMKILASQAGNFDRAIGHNVAKQLLTQYPSATVVFTHNDTMALGALDAVRELRRVPGKDVMIVSVDGLKEVVQHIADGTIAATAFNSPRFGAVAFQTLEKYAEGVVPPPKIILKGPVIDKTNAAAMLSEAF